MEHAGPPPGNPLGSGKGHPVRSQAILLLAFVARILLALAITTLLGRTLSPADFGFFAFVSTLFALAQAFLDAGTGAMAVREIARDPDQERPILEALMNWRRLMGVGLFVLVLGLLPGEPDSLHKLVLAGVALVFLMQAPNALHPIFPVRQSFGVPALLSIWNQVFILASSVLSCLLSLKGPLFAGLLVIREVLSLQILLRVARRRLCYRPRPRFAGASLKPFLKKAMVHGAAVLIHSVYFNIDVFFVRILRGEQELGAYAAAFRPLNPLLQMPGLLMVPILPLLSATVVQNRNRYGEQVVRTAAMLSGIGLVGGAAGFILAPDLVALLYGTRYQSPGLVSAEALRWLAVALSATFTTAAFTTGLLADNQERRLLVLAALGLLVNVSGNLLLVPRHGFAAAAWTTAATELLVMAGAIALFVARGNGGHFHGSRLLSLLPGLALALLLPLVPGPPLVRVLLGCLLGLLAVAGVLLQPQARVLFRLLAPLTHPRG